MFLLTHFWLIIASTIISVVVLGKVFLRRVCVLLPYLRLSAGLAGADKGQASFYLMLLTPIFTIIHHAIVLFLPTYRPSHLGFDASLKGPTFAQPIQPPNHTARVYLAFLVLVSVLWTMSLLTTFYLVGSNAANEVKGLVRQTGPVECAFGIIETGISWVIFVMCLSQRIFRYQGLPAPPA